MPSTLKNIFFQENLSSEKVSMTPAIDLKHSSKENKRASRLGYQESFGTWKIHL